jgi:tetratricopeptide (TPR) repeat protein
VFVAWLPGLACGFVDLDNPATAPRADYVVHGLTAEGWRLAWGQGFLSHWVPLSVLSMMVDWELWGDRAGGHHLTNQLLHALNAGLVFLLLARLTGSRAGAAAVALLFALHPLRVEAVVWLSSRKDLLSAFWALTALLLYVWWREAPRPGRYTLALAAAVLAMLSKAMVMLPVLMLVLDFWPLRRGVPWRRPALVLEKAPFFVLSAVVAVVALRVNDAAGALHGLATIPLGQRLGTAAVVYQQSFLHTLWPEGLAVYYPRPVDGFAPVTVAGAAALFVASSAVAFASLRRAPWVTAGWTWWVCWILPFSGLLQAGDQAGADRYTYLASVGLLVAVVWSFAAMLPAQRQARLAAAAAVAAACLACLLVTWRLIPTWRDTESLYRRALAVTSPNVFVEMLLGGRLLRQGDAAEAEALMRQAAVTSPHLPTVRILLSRALAARDHDDEALEVALEALRMDPKSAAAHVQVATLLGKRRNFGPAAGHLATAVSLAPSEPDGWRGLIALVRVPGAAEKGLPYVAALQRDRPDDPELARVRSALETAASNPALAAPAPAVSGPATLEPAPR